MALIHSSATRSPLRSAFVSEGTAPRPTLLVVDDEEGPRQSLRVVFKDLYDVVLADSGPAALAIAHSRRVDAAVLDIRMNGMSGTELLGQLKQLDPRIEVVMLTACETVETARQAIRYGACDYLTKPFEITGIRAAVENAIQRRQLAEAMLEGTRRLQELQEELRNQQLKGELARSQNEIYASVMHDLGSPLTAVSVLLEMVNADLNATRGEQTLTVREQLGRVSKQVARCLEISRRYLNYARDRGTSHESVRINQALTDTRELLRSQPNARRHQLQVSLMPADLAIRINGTDLVQALMNLVINAFQASSDPLVVSVSAHYLSQPLDSAAMADTSRSLFLAREDFANRPPLVAIHVQDTGPGISEQHLGKIFDSYFTTKPTGQGSGLGLVIVRRLVGNANGAIRVETEAGRGTTFTLFLPVQAD